MTEPPRPSEAAHQAAINWFEGFENGRETLWSLALLLDRFAAQQREAARAEEREACAQLADWYADKDPRAGVFAALYIRDAIRARSGSPGDPTTTR